MLEWLQDNKILEYIIKECNTVVLSRSLEIFKFINTYSQIPYEIIDLIWDSLTDKHETTVRAIYELFVEMTYFLNKE